MEDYWHPRAEGMYDPAYEHDACGVGLITNIKGERSYSIVRAGLDMLINLGHRGAVGSDPETGDGAGILMQIPHAFLKDACADIGLAPARGRASTPPACCTRRAASPVAAWRSWRKRCTTKT